MTRSMQELFDTAVLGVLQQGALCKAFGGGCYYRHQGMACAIGHLLDDDTANALDALGSPAIGPVLRSETPIVPQELQKPELARFLERIQMAHDGAVSLKHFKARALDVATVYNLNPSKVENFDA